ncbi:GGDEF domain-containing response regulator [Marinomonas posidonica]|uniref:Response regulator receiver modulated diguanylate cyclase/phosphodiesterase n=1 Tax=Marinomonas posidonica (strain CECT 7376 / NCIMB 14433 / IVIA-Po-181) TaxID=491952 RepID=F6CST4_MARPP|nr:EAL domain-containing response regulator [Marinomonas posidonica]AEF53924.1 response regulator receiver modulated diguanylate cyclase/phosphodiesterase [Marinomonas posidonica IVIA-Po-181]
MDDSVPTVLIVDDVPENLRILKDVISSLDCQLLVANSGERALELLERTQPCLVLLDVMMGGIDGFETCRRIRTLPNGKDLPVIFVTALADEINRGFEAGGHDYISKPFRLEEVRARVCHQLERFQLVNELKDLTVSLEDKVRERTADLNLLNRNLRKEINERRYMQDRLKYLAQHDFVTQLYNRDALDEHVSLLISIVQSNQATQVPYFVLIDVNEFRLINDSCGCIAGDELLHQIAELITELMDPKNDFGARLSGDKFVIVLRDGGVSAVESFFRAFNQLLEDFLFNWDDRQFRMSVTQVAMPITEDMVSFEQVVMLADEVCYSSKKAGVHSRIIRNAQDLAYEEHRGNLNWGLRIIDGLEKDLFEVHFQQVCSLVQQEPKKKIEILVRLKDESSGGLIYPNEFIRAAERFGIISKIDRWVIRHTMAELSERTELWQEVDQVALNVSALSVRQADFSDFILEQLEYNQLDGSKFCFEVTETEALNNFTDTRQFMSKLHEQGCSIALDDFGTGFSSFAYLMDLPFDLIKIDGMFIKDMHVNEIHFGMVDSIVKLAKMMNKPVVAEFVENQEIVDQLKRLGVEWGQGYHFHKPEKL